MLGDQIHGAWPEFPVKHFESLAAKNLADLEFHGRVHQFADALARCLPEDVSAALKILRNSLPPLKADNEPMNDGWLQWPVGHFIAEHGLADFEGSFETMIELTQRFSSEFAVRPFVEQEPQRTFAVLRELTSHESEHVRRWCSEGVRPRLPWGKRLNALVHDPSPIWPILDAIKDDPSLYVRKSVANCINDITKDHPEAVLDRMEAWQKNAGAGRAWIIRHALRSLIKAGHPRALALMGYSPHPPINVSLRAKPARCKTGDSVTLEADLENTTGKPQSLMLDLLVSFPGKTGVLREKVFKWTTLELDPHAARTLRKTLPLFRVTTTRSLYPGEHFIELQINGGRYGRECVVLLFHGGEEPR